MARGRMLGKRLSTSQRFARLHDLLPKLAEFSQSLYPLLLAHSDDFGRQQGDVFTVKHQVHPTSPRSLADFERALEALHQTGLILRYEAAGRCYIQIVQFDAHQSGLHKRTKSEFPEVPGHSKATPELPAQEKRREEKGTELKGTEGKRGADAPNPSALVALWNDLTHPPIHRCKEFTAKRRQQAQARIRERSLETWQRVIEQIQASSFCRGENDRGWVATFDWLLQPDVAVKVLEGKYDDRETKADRQRERALGPVYQGRAACPHEPECNSREYCAAKQARDAGASVE